MRAGSFCRALDRTASMGTAAWPPWPIWTPSSPGDERPSILQLLPTHVGLLQRHLGRMRALARIARDRGIGPAEQAFIIASVDGDFGSQCVISGAGLEFLVTDGKSAAMVIAMDRVGVRRMLADVIHEDAEHIKFPPERDDGIPALVVDGSDQPGLAFVALAELLRE